MDSRNKMISARLFGSMLIFLAIAFAGATIMNTTLAPVALAHSVQAGGPGSFSGLVKKARSSVVNISSVKIIKGKARRGPMPFGGPSNPQDPMWEFFDRFFGDRIPKEFKQRGLGSGFIIDEDGHILTNNHVVEKTDQIMVKLFDESEFEAEIIGRDPKTDLALIRIKTDRTLKPLELGDSDTIQVGDWVVAIGNPFGLGNTATAGIISAKYRHLGAGPYDNFIQTDAPINPGNSGGPLLNTEGKVIGINTAIFSQSGGSVGIGFAIPIKMAQDLLPQLKKGKVVRGWLGVMIQKITSDLKDKLKLKTDKGALVADVSKGGPAEKAGIKRGDVIIEFDGKKVKEMNELPYMVASTPLDKKVTVKVIRKGREKELRVKIGELKDEKEDKIQSQEKSDLGMSVEELSPELARRLGLSETTGLVVVNVQPHSPASEAGLRQGDVILEIDQVPVRDLDEFDEKMNEYDEKATILLLVKRKKTTIYLTLKLGD